MGAVGGRIVASFFGTQALAMDAGASVLAQLLHDSGKRLLSPVETDQPHRFHPVMSHTLSLYTLPTHHQPRGPTSLTTSLKQCYSASSPCHPLVITIHHERLVGGPLVQGGARAPVQQENYHPALLHHAYETPCEASARFVLQAGCAGTHAWACIAT